MRGCLQGVRQKQTRRDIFQPKHAFLRRGPVPGPRQPGSQRRPAHPAGSSPPVLPRTCDIPELQPHQGLAVPVDDFEREIHADGGPVVLGEELVDVALDNAGFAHAQLPDHQHLEEVLPALRHAAARSFPAGHPSLPPVECGGEAGLPGPRLSRF